MAKSYGLNLDSRLSASLERRFKEKVEDNIFNKNVTMRYLWKNKRTEDGGESISQVITYLVNSNGGSLAGPYSTFDTTPQDNETTLNDRFRVYVQPVTISDVEVDENVAPKVFSLLEQKQDNAMETMERDLNIDMWASSTGSGDINSLLDIVNTSGTIHSLASASYWQSTVTTSGSFASQGLDDMRSTTNQISNEGLKMPTFIVTTRAIHEYYEKFGTTKSTIYLPPLAKEQGMSLGYNSLYFRGVPVEFDTQAASGTMLFLNTDSLKFVVSKNMSFSMGGWRTPTNQLAKTNPIRLRGQIFCSARRDQGRMNSITA